MRLRLKILSGFLILALMLTLAGVWSIYELRSNSSTVQDLLSENYKSINAGKTMLESLERQDSAVLLLLLGRKEEGRGIMVAADSLFGRGLEAAAHNVTLPGEEVCIETIATTYAAYRNVVEMPIVDSDRMGSLNWYFSSVHARFREVKSSLHDLIALNDRAMFETASGLRRGADRAVMPGIVAIMAALVFSIMFSYFVDLYMIDPIVRITRGVRGFLQSRDDYEVTVQTRDELSELAQSIGSLIAHVRGGAEKPEAQP